MSRKTFACDFKDGPCDDPNCKVGYCVLEHRSGVQYSHFTDNEIVRLEQHQRPLTKEAMKVVRQYCRDHKIQATRETVSRLMGSPAVLSLAQHRMDTDAEMLEKFKGLVRLK